MVNSYLPYSYIGVSFRARALFYCYHNDCFDVQEEYSQMATALDKGVEAGWLRPIISQEFPLAEAADAHVSLNNHPGDSAGKIILSL